MLQRGHGEVGLDLSALQSSHINGHAVQVEVNITNINDRASRFANNKAASNSQVAPSLPTESIHVY